jgi:hypothetical protein
MYSPAGAATDYGWGVRVRRHLAHAEGVLYGMELGSVTLKINTQHTHTLKSLLYDSLHDICCTHDTCVPGALYMIHSSIIHLLCVLTLLRNIVQRRCSLGKTKVAEVQGTFDC